MSRESAGPTAGLRGTALRGAGASTARHVPSSRIGPRVNLTLPGGVSLACRDSAVSSANEPVILLHGVGVTADLNWGATYADLCQHFRVVAPDLPGHVRYSRPWPKFGIGKCADHIGALADSLGIDRFVACGYSMGSLVGEFTSHEWICDIDVPVSVLVTTRDSVVPASRQMKLADALSHGTVIEVEGDHGVFVESPRLFAEKVLEACLAVNTSPPEKISLPANTPPSKHRRILPWRRS
jgi:pimeloyl-ACP methyl ester carboxylesterase